jgi:Uma2 family endonuclease
MGREVNLPLYAQNNIGEYWIVNLIDDCVEVYRQPQTDSTYAQKHVRHRGETLDIADLPGIAIRVDDVL